MGGKIAIIGAGISGLTFARLLEVNKIDYDIFEQQQQQSSTNHLCNAHHHGQDPIDILRNSG
jgi:2-polyprenyl-6-methoxyphenol hydroxylase-like FAD-dependent oxidoreductase